MYFLFTHNSHDFVVNISLNIIGCWKNNTYFPLQKFDKKMYEMSVRCEAELNQKLIQLHSNLMEKRKNAK